jgi:hypothetical protein
VGGGKASGKRDGLESRHSAYILNTLAYYRSRDKEQAIKTIKQALKLNTNHPELQARLKSFR